MTLHAVAQAVESDATNISRVERSLQKASPELAEKLVSYFGREAIDELQILYPERYAAEPEVHAHD